jgi:F420-dependent oxidoreductase-like protein
MIKFGLQHPSFTYDGEGGEIFQTLKKTVSYAEESGFDSFWVMDHFLQIPQVGKLEEPMLEGWSTISALAPVTRKIRVGTLVTGNIYRNPAVLAKMGATVDVLSNGRLFMGIGAGWFETEANAYGIPFYTVPERLKRLEEALQIIKGMWNSDRFSFRGKYYRISEALCYPKPIQKPCPPILVGGSGEKVTLKLVAKYGDACNLVGGPKTLKAKLEKLKEHCKTVGRDYDDILKTKLGHLIIGEDDKEVALMVQRHRQPGLTDEQYNEWVTYGTPGQVVRKIHELVNAGLQYLIFNAAYGNEERVLKLFVEEVMPEAVNF